MPVQFGANIHRNYPQNAHTRVLDRVLDDPLLQHVAKTTSDKIDVTIGWNPEAPEHLIYQLAYRDNARDGREGSKWRPIGEPSVLTARIASDLVKADQFVNNQASKD